MDHKTAIAGENHLSGRQRDLDLGLRKVPVGLNRTCELPSIAVVATAAQVVAPSATVAANGTSVLENIIDFGVRDPVRGVWPTAVLLHTIKVGT